ncbi:hypothetical protein BDN72DRAFT_839633 [Pluteus cervinus]|uniref:Uncharacterized protein n=1 Tax=Pluteus cervinus TaxID=181527 RepID=A0ACD3AVI7_9AGAR|nr:hypothetical protein BDN72DRAFT_839633 [Pluteus cervinus]
MSLDAVELPRDHPSRKIRFDDSTPIVFAHQDLLKTLSAKTDDSGSWIGHGRGTIQSGLSMQQHSVLVNRILGTFTSSGLV